jgi:hypothetical protein
MSELEGLVIVKAAGIFEVRDKVSPTKRLSRTCVKLNCIKERLAVENVLLADRKGIKSLDVSCGDEKFASNNESPAES